MEVEVASRMLGRLDYVKLAPRCILDAGSGPGRDARALIARYAGSVVSALGSSAPMPRRRGLLARRRGRARLAVCADLAQLPLPQGTIDLAWSNMALHWLSEPLAAFQELQRVLAPEGLLMFSTLGPDTLKELRAAAGERRVHAFLDMHDLGDMLVAAGFSAPVMDMELLSLTYPDSSGLLADLRASGQTCARADRPRGLAGKRFGARVRSGLGPHATFEVVYGHAWKAAPRVAEEVKTVRVFKRIS